MSGNHHHGASHANGRHSTVATAGWCTDLEQKGVLKWYCT